MSNVEVNPVVIAEKTSVDVDDRNLLEVLVIVHTVSGLFVVYLS